MSDINVDWAAAPVDRDYTAAALEGAQAGQAQRAIGALRGINLDDPGSLNKGIANLVRAGAADQASALMGLQINRSLYTGLPGFLAQVNGQQPQAAPAPSGDPAFARPAPPGAANADPASVTQAPAQAANVDPAFLHAEVAKDTRAYAALSPADQAAMKPKLEAKYAGFGFSKDTIDGALQQVSTPEGAQQFAGVHDAHAAAYGGNADPAAIQSSLPQGMTPPQQGDGVDPYTWAKNYLAHPQWGAYESMLKSRAGVDLGYTARAQAIMGPEFSAEANVRNARAQAAESGAGAATADLATVTLPNGSTMQVPKSMALELGAGGALHGPTPEQQSFQTSRGSAAGGAPYENLTLKGPNGEEIPMSREEFARRARGGSLPTGPTIQGAANLEGQSKELTAESTEAGKRLTQYPVAIANGQTLLGLASTVGTGAYTDALAKAAKALPLTHSAKDYAANAGLLKQDLAGTFKAALNGLPVPRIGSEAKAITDAIPSSASPQDQVKVYAAGNLAAAQYQQAHDKFIQDWAANQNNPRDLSQAQHAWAQGPGGASLFTMPAWQGVSIGGKPAVVSHSFGGHEYVIPLYGLLGKNAKPIMVR